MSNESTPLHNANLNAAITLAKAGFCIFPAGPDKVPCISGWQEGSCKETKINEWWWKFPYAIPAIPCGVNRLLVVDCDVKNDIDGNAKWDVLCDNNGFDQLGCMIVSTPSGGRHFYFRQIREPLLRNTAGRLDEAIDTRGDGGYVIGPGAVLPDGRRYETRCGAINVLPDLPEGLDIHLRNISAAKPKQETTSYLTDYETDLQAERSYALKALQSEVERVTNAANGSRNATLNNAAFCLGTLIPTRGISAGEVETELSKAAYQVGLGADETRKTIKSGLGAGMASPRESVSERNARLREGVDLSVLTLKLSTQFSSQSWPDPKPLPTDLPSVDPFDPNFLPETLKPWVMDIAERMQCPPDFVAIPAIVALGAVIGRQMGIKPMQKDNWTVIPNLWGMIVGQPGVMKSPAMDEALAPLKILEARSRKEHASAVRDYKTTLDEYDLRNKASRAKAKIELKDNPSAEISLDIGEEPVAPTPKRFIASDNTYEALGEILVHNPNGILAFRDELVSLLKTLDREENASARGFYLQGWNGTSGYTFDRIMRGHQHIDAVCVSMLGSTQPGRLSSYINRALQGSENNDGLIQRFGLLVWPDHAKNWRHIDRFPDAPAHQKVFECFERLSKIGATNAKPSLDPSCRVPALSFDQQADGLFLDWRTDLEHRVRSSELHPALESHFAKYRKLVPALALIMHLASGSDDPVALSALQQAIAFSKYLESHAMRAYGAGHQMEILAGNAIIAHIRKGDLEDGFTARDIHQRAWSRLTDRTQVQNGLDLLADLDWLQSETLKTGGRPKEIYRINPKVRL